MDDLSRRGIEHFNAGRFEAALRCFRDAVAAGENVPESRVFIGHVSGSLGRPAAAVAEFVSVISDFPRHLPAYAGLANMLLRQAPARDAASVKALLRVLALKPGDESFRASLAETLRACGQALRSVGELEAAEKALTRALVLGRDGAARRRLRDVLLARAESFLAAGDLKKAEGSLRKVLVLAPEDAKARRALVRLLRRRGLELVHAGRLEEAEKTLRRAVALSPRDREALRSRVEVKALRAKSESSRRTAARLRKADKIRVMRGRGGALVAAGRLALAEKALRRALLVGPGDTGAGRQLAEVLRMREQAEEARLQEERAARGEKLRALLEELKASGQAYRSSARISRAVKLLPRILKLDPAGARARLLAGGILFSSGALTRGRALIAQALSLDRGELLPGEKFSALMKLGRYKAAIAAAERLLDGQPSLADLRALRDPWEWDDLPLAGRKREIAKLERALGRAKSPWPAYYRADLRGPEEFHQLQKLAAFSKRRYGWMFAKAGIAALCAGRFPEAESWLRGALTYKTVDWRSRGFLAEALLCQGRSAEAFAEMDRALPEAPADEAGQVAAWRGAFDLWQGRYESAVSRFDSALRLGAPYALSWRAGALLKLGRAEEALAQLDAALELYPRDLEAYVWRGEAKRSLGMHREALKDLNEPSLSDPDRSTPIWLWALFNRALVKAALGDRAGLKSDFDAIPADVREHIRRKTGHEDMVNILEAGLELSRGFRREEYKQAIWMV
jgi:tetratricopeptide (TPR) repeat protein